MTGSAGAYRRLRRNAGRPLRALALIGLLATLACGAGETPPGDEAAADSTRLAPPPDFTLWHDHEAGLALAAGHDRPILMLFTAAWSPECCIMREGPLAADSVARRLDERFVRIAVDVDRRADLAARYGAGDPPRLLFLTPARRRIAHQAGFVAAEPLCDMLDYVSSGRYLAGPFRACSDSL